MSRAEWMNQVSLGKFFTQLLERRRE